MKQHSLLLLLGYTGLSFELAQPMFAVSGIHHNRIRHKILLTLFIPYYASVSILTNSQTINPLQTFSMLSQCHIL